MQIEGTEKLHLFAAEVDDSDRVGAGGGEHAEGEDIEVVELPLATALAAMVGLDGRRR